MLARREPNRTVTAGTCLVVCVALALGQVHRQNALFAAEPPSSSETGEPIQKAGESTDVIKRADSRASRFSDDSVATRRREGREQGAKQQGPIREAIPIRCTARGTSARSVRQQAIADLPLDKLDQSDEQRVRAVLRTHSLFRRLPTLSFPVDARTYRYFALHPEVAVSIWRALNLSRFQLEPVEPGVYKASAGDGSTGVIEVLYRSESEHLILCRGEYKSPLLVRPVKAEALMHLKSEFYEDDQGQPAVRHFLDLFVTFPSLTVETVARIISPISYLIADRNFHEVSLFVYVMWTTMVRQPQWMQQLADRLEGVTPVDKAQLLLVTAQVHDAAQLARRAARDGRERLRSRPGSEVDSSSAPSRAPRTAGADRAVR